MMALAGHYASFSSCERLQVGAVFVKDKRVLACGFNEAPSGLHHCQGESVCNSAGFGCQETIHAEENAIINAARIGVSILGADLYCTHLPCRRCFGKLINAGTRRVYYKSEYRLDDAKKMADAVGIIIEKVEDKCCKS